MYFINNNALKLSFCTPSVCVMGLLSFVDKQLIMTSLSLSNLVVVFKSHHNFKRTQGAITPLSHFYHKDLSDLFQAFCNFERTQWTVFVNQ